jgi:hypothetical protein
MKIHLLRANSDTGRTHLINDLYQKHMRALTTQKKMTPRKVGKRLKWILLISLRKQIKTTAEHKSGYN